MQYWQMLAIVLPLVFFAGFIDSIAGGGGLISMPAFMLTGLPMHNVAATNKFAACIGTGVAAHEYYKKGAVKLVPALVSAAFAFVGSAAGAQIVLYIDSQKLKLAFLWVLPFVALFVLFGARIKKNNVVASGAKLYIQCAFIGLFIGAYDGLIGPGTGTFLIFAYTALSGFDYVTASGNAKIVNLASNLAAVVTFIFAGKVLYALALPAAAVNIVGSLIGSRLALKKGQKFVKYMLMVVLVLIFAKLIYDVFSPSMA